MNLDDFRYMWCGKPLKPLTSQEAHLLAPIDIRGKGHDRALLLLHGFSSSPAVYREFIPALASAYDAIVGPILPGHADSIAAFSSVKAGDWLASAEDACLLLINNYHKVDVLGLSLGGLLACHLSQKFALHHLYLLAPALSLQLSIPMTLTFARVMRRLGFQTIINKAGSLHSQRHNEIAYRQLPIATVIELLTMIDELQFSPPTCSTDLFFGCFDKTVDSVSVAKRFSHLANVTTHWLANSAHVLPLDGDIETIVNCMLNNLQTD